ncbi:MAG: hypothetical protein ABSH06_29390 [Thermodesulfobacteriota bacterium]
MPNGWHGAESLIAFCAAFEFWLHNEYFLIKEISNPESIVYTVRDASGDPSEMVLRMTLAALAQARVILVHTNVVFCELQRTWNRPDTVDLPPCIQPTLR